MQLLRVLVTLTLISGWISTVAVAACFDHPGAGAPQSPGFEFVVEDEVEGPDDRGLFHYTYRIYREDRGQVDYGEATHFGLLLSCAVYPAGSLIRGGGAGIGVAGDVSTCGLRIGEARGDFVVPGASNDCTDTGFEVSFCGGGLIPDGDFRSYPQDTDDPVLVVSFTSLSDPTEGTWFMRGGAVANAGTPGATRQLLREPVALLASQTVQVPSCLFVVPTESVSWGLLKSGRR